MNKNSVDYKIERLATAVKDLRAFRHDSSVVTGVSADINSNTSLLFWYAPTKRRFQCHILGSLVHGGSSREVVANAEKAFVKLYNQHFRTRRQSIEQCSFEQDPSEWTHKRLLSEYLKKAKPKRDVAKSTPVTDFRSSSYLVPIKKRGRPAKSAVAAPAKKRGRPAKSAVVAPVKKRGRPAKSATAPVKRSKTLKNSADAPITKKKSKKKESTPSPNVRPLWYKNYYE